MIIFTYIFLLLLMIIMIINGIMFCLKYAPLKIKNLTLFVLALITLRYITLIIFYTQKSINYLYSLRFFYFTNILCIPIIAIIVIYILFRSDKIKFKLILIISMILLVLFSTFIIAWGTINLTILNNSLYTISIDSENIINIFYVIINVLFIVASMYVLNKPNINKIGVRLIILSSIVVIFEIVLSFFGICVLPEKIVGDILWVLTLNYALYEFKK